jgi:hypothetical protein
MSNKGFHLGFQSVDHRPTEDWARRAGRISPQQTTNKWHHVKKGVYWQERNPRYSKKAEPDSESFF